MDLADCRKALTDATSKGGHVCTSAHLEADLRRLASGLKDPLPMGGSDSRRESIERGGVETGATQLDLGYSFWRGDGVPQDFAQAVAWYARAAEKGGPIAQFSLGLMYYNGKGVAQDFAQAMAWWRKAAEEGHTEAQFNLGAGYANG